VFRKLLLASGLAALVVTQAAGKDLKSIGITLGTLGNPFFVVVVKGAEAAAKKINPDVKVTAVGAEYDLGRQFAQIDSFIAAGVDLILINAVDPVAIGPAVAKARKAGIVVIAVGDKAAGSDGYVAINNKQAGERTCQYMLDVMGGKGNVLIINGPQVSAVVARVEGCQEVIAKYPNVKVLSSDQDGKGSRDGGYAVGQTLLTRFPSVDGIFGINDPTAIGAALAAKQLGRKDLVITGVDGSPDIEAALKDPATRIIASGSQDPFNMAADSVKIGAAIVAGHKPTETEESMDSVLVTSKNVADFKGWNATH
jgi:ribose transport system substrate-binding protein